MFSARVARLVAGKVGYTVSCFLAAVASCKDQTVGSRDTDTLILVHILAGGQTAVGFPSASPSAAAADNGAAGGAVTVAPNAKCEIPCVY